MERAGHVVLESPPRRRVFDLIQAEPGISVSELARKADMYWTAAAFHIAHLTSAGLVRAVRIGRRRVLFPTSILQGEPSSHDGILSEPACRRVAEIIVRHPGRRVWDLCEISGMSSRAVYHHVKRLVESGLVTSIAKGAYRGLEPTPALVERLLRHASANDLPSDE